MPRGRQVHSYRGKERKDRGGPGWGLEEPDLLLPWRPSPPLAAPLEVFQRALLYLIKASQAAGSAPRLVLFILASLPSNAGWNLEGEARGAKVATMRGLDRKFKGPTSYRF